MQPPRGVRFNERIRAKRFFFPPRRTSLLISAAMFLFIANPRQTFPGSADDSTPANVPDGQDTGKPAPSETHYAKYKHTAKSAALLGVIDARRTGWVALRCCLSIYDPAAGLPRPMHFLPNGEHGPPAGAFHQAVAAVRPDWMLDTDDTVTRLPYPAFALLSLRQSNPLTTTAYVFGGGGSLSRPPFASLVQCGSRGACVLPVEREKNQP